MKMLSRPVKNKLFLAGFFILSLCLAGCGDTTQAVTIFNGQTMGTTYQVKLSKNIDEALKKNITQEIEGKLIAINQIFSTYLVDSEVSQFNQLDNIALRKQSKTFVNVLDEALIISRSTQGAYDVTVGPVVDLWGFGPTFSVDKIPSKEDISEALAKVGYQHLILDKEDSLIRKAKPYVQLDFSSIAKGYGVDEIAGVLEANGYKNYMVEIGGELRVSGKSPRGDAWKIAVEKPSENERSIQRVLALHNTAVATSGDYRNFFEHQGVRYSHAINPATGWPVKHNLVSVTVLAETAMKADAWATALMVLGYKKGYDLAIDNGLNVLFIVKEGDAYIERVTLGFDEKTKG
jgi:thiamine biosynthesis lipoprotein